MVPHPCGLYIGSVSLKSNPAICNKKYKTVITLSSNYLTSETIPHGIDTNKNIIATEMSVRTLYIIANI